MSDPITRLNAALEGRYRIERQLGEGGMATVYLADDLRHERKVALKVLKPELAAVVGADRFLAEIKTTANLQHPHILPLFDSGEADSFLFYVMPYVEGESLRERLDREHQLPVDEAVQIAKDVAEALGYAHSHGVIHRDIKPANILLHAGRPLIADFGIALALSAGGAGRLTETGLSLGTPHYMSPEQATGDLNVGAATDIYAVGCVLYEMLIGEPPYTGSTPQAVLGKIVTGDADPATKHRRSVPPNVDAAIQKALEKVPADRFASAEEFTRALGDAAFRHGATSRSSRSRSATAAGPWNRLTLGFASLAAVLAIALGWSLTRPVRAPRVEKFESPFRRGQEPFDLTGRQFTQPSQFTISPDGSMVVYVAGGPRGGLWVRRWDELDATPVRGTEGAIWPTVSPDGTEVAFDFRGLKVVALAGGPVRTLRAGNAPRWAADGYIYHACDAGRSVCRTSPTSGQSEVISTSLDDSERRRMLAWLLPGGKGALLAVQLLDESWATRALDLTTGEERELVAGGAAFYSETGHLVWVAEGTLMAARFDPGAMELTGPPVALMEGVGWASYSPTGDLVYTTEGSDSRSNSVELVWVTREGDITPVDSGWTFETGSNNPGWALSPDGTRVALSMLTDTGRNIWLKELPHGPLTPLTFEREVGYAPFWSPDGSHVTYFSAGAVNEVPEALWSRRADGVGAPQRLLDSIGVVQGAWSPDGSTLVLRTVRESGSRDVRESGSRDIVAFDPAGGGVRPLVADSAYNVTDPAISQDGRWLAYTSNETGQSEVFVRPFPDVESGTWQISLGGGSNPLWSHDGRELYYVSGPEPERNLMAARYAIDGGFRIVRRDALFPVPDNYFLGGVGSNTIDIAPDDQRFLMGRRPLPDADAQPKLVLVVNFDEELRERVPAN